MNTVHPLLRGRANILIVILWGLVTAVLVLLFRPLPWSLLIVGACCGAWGGFMQLRSIAESKRAFLCSGSVFGVERALNSTTWGRFYHVFLWSCIATFFVGGYLWYRDPRVGIVAYFPMALVRDCITLRSTFALEKGAKGSR